MTTAAPQNDYAGFAISLIKRELDQPEIRERVLQPLLKWFFRHIIPYVLLIIGLNFFLTIAGVSLVLYIRGRR